MPVAPKPQGPRPEAQFKIMSGALKAFTRKDADGNDRRYLSCTASSSIKDLHEDEFTPECVEKMAKSALDKAMTIFLNHQYRVPEDVFGSTTASKSVVRLGDDGTPYTDMDLEVLLNETNPRAVQTYDAVEAGVKLGVSIGAIIKDWHPRDPKDTWGWDGMVISDCELLEASIVGIPANPRSWVQNAVKSLQAAIKAAAEEADEAEEHASQVIAALADASKEADGDTDDTIDPSPINDDENSGDPEEALEGDDAGMETEKAAKCPECGETGCKNPAHKSADPSDEQPPSDGAAEEKQDTETTKDAPAQAAVVVSTSSVEDAIDLLVRGYQTEIEKLKAQLSQATTERDEALEALKTATQIVDKIASLPIGRKTAFAQATTTFKDRFGGVYDDDFLKFLERTTEQ